jgi:hypothetical protein
MEERRPVESHRDLIAWQRAMKLCSATYDATAAFRRLNASAFSPIRRLPLGVRRFGNAETRSNAKRCRMHESHGRLTTDAYRQFLGIARGLLKELETRIRIADGLG